jgi:hypothetical protein
MTWIHKESGDVVPSILTSVVERRWLVSFTLVPFYPRGKAFCTQRIWGYVGPSNGLEVVEKRNIQHCRESNLGLSTRRQTLHPASVEFVMCLVAQFCVNSLRQNLISRMYVPKHRSFNYTVLHSSNSIICKRWHSGLENREYGLRDPLCWPRNSLYQQKLTLTSQTLGGRSVGISPGLRPRSFEKMTHLNPELLFSQF